MKARFDGVRSLSLRWKILLPFVILSAFTWIIAADILGRSSESSILAQGQTETKQVATAAARHLELEISHLKGEVTLLAVEGQLMIGDRSIAQVLQDFGPDLMTSFSTKAVGVQAFQADLVKVIDTQGRVRLQLRRKVFEAGAIEDDALLAAARKGTSIGGIVMVAGQPTAYVVGVSPVDLGEAHLAAFLVGTSLNDDMLTEGGPPADHEVFVVGARGVIARAGPHSTDPQWAAKLDGSGPGKTRVSGSDYLVSSVSVQAPFTPSLRVVAAMPTAPLIAKAKAGRTEAWLVLGAGLAAFIAMALWLSSKLTRPVRAVTLAAQTLAAGDLGARAPVSANDEIGRLAVAFNSMGDELSSRARRLSQAFDELTRLSETDALTGLLNHRAVHVALHREMSRSQRHGLEFCVAVADVDDFKLINDTYGHPAGDVVLRQVATVLLANTRAADIVGRHGGDEFMVILPETSADDAVAVANKLRRAMHEYPLVTGDGLSIPVRLSLGTAAFPSDGAQTNELLTRADANLYLSKRRGGDLVTCADEQEARERLAMGGFSMLDSLVAAVDNKDRYTRRHSEDVTNHALIVAECLGLSQETQRVLRVAGLLHDVGKIGVPDALLRKPGRLSPDEYEIIKRHAALGASIIQGIPDEEDTRSAVASHHEHWDGRGYPSGTKGPAIPQLGRILAVADAYSAMTSDRPYRKALTREQALAELEKGAGSQFDPELVRVFLLTFGEDRREWVLDDGDEGGPVVGVSGAEQRF